AAVNPIQPDDATLIRTGDGTQHSPTVMRFGEVGESWDYTFIDDRADNPYQLLYGGEAGTVSRLIHRSEDGIAKISEVLDFAEKPVDTLTLVAEGNAGELWLGKDFITAQNIQQYRTQLESWRESLSSTADILLYSCFTALGAVGESLVGQIAEATGVDVAASVDATGSANYGGNWALEYATGAIASVIPFTDRTLANWDGKLATVTVTTGSGAGSLKNVIESVATMGDTITFDPTAFAGVVTIDLTGSEINWSTDNLTLEGTGQNNLFLDGGGTNRIFNISANNATIKNLTIQNGRESSGVGGGGGIYHNGTGTLTISNSTISGNSVNSTGGGVFVANNSANTIITNSTIFNNTSTGTNSGGLGIVGTFTLSNSTVSGNSAVGEGGGIGMTGDFTIINSTISNNTATNRGGGIASFTGNMTMSNSTVSGNSTGVDGGGIYLNATYTLNLTNSTISGNTAVNGGGLLINGTLNSTNNTIAFNTATAQGGGIQVGTTVKLYNTIVSNNAAVTGVDINGTVAKAQNTLIQNATGATIIDSVYNLIGVNPQLLPLANNGGPTQTHALTATSPAVNRWSGSAPTTDQRGFTRGFFSDIGAFELLPEPTPFVILVDNTNTLANFSQSFDLSLPQSILVQLGMTLAGNQQGYNTQNNNGNWNWLDEGGALLNINLDSHYYDPTLQAYRISLRTALVNNDLNAAVGGVESFFSEEFSSEASENSNTGEQKEEESIENIRATLKNITQETGTHPVIVYALSFPEQLEIILVTPEDNIIRKVIPEAPAPILQEIVKEFRQTVTNPRRPRSYLASSQQLYNWLIAPIESELEGLNIDTLIFSLDAGLRTIPLAALHDGKQFLVEKYSLGIIPSLSLTNTRYRSLRDARVLAMGVSEFSDKDPLPAVPIELSLIIQELNEGEMFLNQDFTFNNLKINSQRGGQQIVHLASHADFQVGEKRNAYIQMWNEQLQLDRLRELGWTQENPIELLVLSACRTALGDLDVELGFAGLAVNTGAKSALASLWYVSDGGTLNLMGEFYRYLYDPNVKIKAEALRQAQIAMIRGESLVGDFWENIARSREFEGANQLLLEGFRDRTFSHPYYWSAFTLIGSPW
ncbi:MULTISPECIES: CHAT domain-containing protein, partial [Spirulina sp. CCY15215]|uniref:CHAT domain-containing protein n=1 Tax=Spirulina sp. CCY15215 TaxID=2767591 RepID=UPI0019505CE6